MLPKPLCVRILLIIEGGSEMGKAARARVINKYSLVATKNNFYQLFTAPAPEYVLIPSLFSGKLNLAWPFARYRPTALTH